MTDFHTLVCPNCHTTNRIPAGKISDHPVCGKCKHPLFLKAPVEVSGPFFRKHIEKTSIPVLVDFWAPWCGPCKMMAPAFKEAAARLEPHVRMVKLNTETDQATATQYRIQSIPTLALFKNGVETARQSGAMDVSNLVAWVTSNTR